MGKLVSLILILVIVDILFLLTGQLAIDSPSSLIIAAIQDPSALTGLNWWVIIINQISILALTSTVVVGLVTRASDILVWIPTSLVFSVLIGDYLTIYNTLASINTPLAIAIMSPILIVFALTLLEWVRGKD